MHKQLDLALGSVAMLAAIAILAVMALVAAMMAFSMIVAVGAGVVMLVGDGLRLLGELF